MVHARRLFAHRPIQIKLVNGKTWSPVADACVGAWMKDASNKMSVYIPADRDGIARLRVTQKDGDVDISYNPKLGCGGNGAINPVLKYDDTLTTYSTGDHPSCAFPESVPLARWKQLDFSTKEVLQYGVVSANTLRQGDRFAAAWGGDPVRPTQNFPGKSAGLES